MIKPKKHDPSQYVIDFSDLHADKAPAVNSALSAAVPPRSYTGSLQHQIINFFSIGSGSSGNSCYIGNNTAGLIIDAGMPPDDVKKALQANGVDPLKLKGLLLTHDHSDHMRHAYSLLRQFPHLRLFCTNRVLQGMLRKHSISKRIKDYHIAIFKEIPFTIADFEITAFEVPHDGSDNMGFSISYGKKNFVIATDMGAISSRARHYISTADFLVIESNYDKQMLLNGPYPAYLKARIQTDAGHMDNAHTAAFLAGIAPERRLKYVFLCHLSQDNNTPEKALATVRSALEETGLRVGGDADTIADRNADIRLIVLPRHVPSRWFVFHPEI